MRSLIGFLFILSLASSALATALSADEWSLGIEAQEIVMTKGQEKWIFSAASEFRAARNQLFYLVTRQGSFDSQWIENKSVNLQTETFNRLLRLWKEAPLRPKVEKSLGTWTEQDGETVLQVKKVLRESKDMNTAVIPALELLWFGCVDAKSLCLGMGQTISNPNSLSNEIAKEEVAGFSPKDIQDFLKRTELVTVYDVEKAFVKAHFPKEMAQWYALKILSRRESLFASKNQNVFLSRLVQFQAGDLIKLGELIKAPAGFDVDFTFDRLDAKVREFIVARYSEVERLAQHALAHFPMMTYEYDKGLGGFTVGPGFMFRVKRHILKNPHSQSPETMYRINDSVDVIVTVNVGYHKKFGPAAIGGGVGPGYMQKYIYSSFASSKENATRTPWALSKEILLGFSMETMKAGHSLTLESGWLANGIINGNVSIFGQNRIRPQANIVGSYRMLRRSYIYINDDGSALVGFGKSNGYDASAQGFLKVISRLAKIPFVNWNKSWMDQSGGVYQITKAALSASNALGVSTSDSIYEGDESQFLGKWPEVKYDASYVNSYFYLNLGMFRVIQSKWNGFFEFNPVEGSTVETVNQRRRFLLMEDTSDTTTKFSLSVAPETRICSTWAAFEASLEEPVHFTDGSFKITCSEGYSNQRPLGSFGLQRVSELLRLDLSKAQGIVPLAQENKKEELTWDVQLSWTDLAPLFTKGHSGWIEKMVKELEQQKKDKTIGQDLTFQEVQERFHFIMTLRHILTKKTETEKARAFFSWVSSSTTKDTLLRSFLKHVSQPAVRFQVFRPFAKNSALLEQTYSYGKFQDTSTFKIIEEKNKWLGLK